MAENVHFLGAPFDFERIGLTTPNGLQGGSYFTKLTHNNEPLYIQTPKCGTRQGIVIGGGKKAHYDILLDSASNTPSELDRTAFIAWLERVEERVVQLLHEKGCVWFTNEMSIEDIRSLFTSPIKSFRGGTQFLIRANIASSKTNSGQFACSVYDERENQTNIEYITPDHAIISIIEVTGVRFTSRSFQLELASKQIAVLANKPIFETCIIKKNVPILAPAVAVAIAAAPAIAAPITITESFKPTEPGLTEIDLGVTATESTPPQSIHIKSPVEVYYAMYRAAIKRAREAKKIAIESYLDAKNIKNVYKLNLVDDDDDDDEDDDDDDVDDDVDVDVDVDDDDVDDDDIDDDENEGEYNEKPKLDIHDSATSLNISDGIIAL